MGLPQREWAAKETKLLKNLLGNKCSKCGDKRLRKLQFDCIEPCGDAHHKMEWSWRISFYRSQYKINNLQLLCEACHPQKSREDKEKFPF